MDARTPPAVERVRDDFDRIALLPSDPCDPNERYHGFLLRQLPPAVGNALDLGCGTGAFSRLLARRADHVLGLDVAPNMIRAAREHEDHRSNIEYHVVDIERWAFPDRSFDCVVAIASLHHLEMRQTLERMRRSLRPGGTLLVLDLLEDDGPIDRALGVLAFTAAPVLRLLRTGRPWSPAAARRAWDEHGKLDRYPRFEEVRQLCLDLLPGARIRRHLFWRYSIVWRDVTTWPDDALKAQAPLPPSRSP